MSFSLHDLIYKSNNTAEDQGEAFSEAAVLAEDDASTVVTSSRSRNKKRPRAPPNSTSDSVLLEQFYQQQRHRGRGNSADDEKKARTSAAPSKVYKKRKKRQRWKYPDTFHQTSFHSSSSESETTREELAAARIKKKKMVQRETQHRILQKRWAAKSYSLHDEQDHGGAVRYAARLAYKRKRRKQQQHAYAEKRKSNGTVGDESTFDQERTDPMALSSDHSDVSSDEDRRQKALGSLVSMPSMTATQESVMSASSKNNNSTAEDNHSDDASSALQRDYFQLGFAAPRRQDVGDFSYGTTNLFRGIQWKERMQRSKEIAEEAVVFRPRGRNTMDAKHDPQYYVKMPQVTESWARVGFFHQRTFRTLAARYLIGYASARNKSESSKTTAHRLLRHLTSTSFREVGREYLLMQQAKERGLDYVTFQSHQWQDRTVAARHLGIPPDTVAPPNRIGYTLEKDPLQDSAIRHRKRVVTYLSERKVPLLDVNSTGNQSAVSSERILLNIDSSDEEAEENSSASRRRSPPVLRSDEEKKPSAIDDTFVDASFFVESLVNECDYVHTPGTTPPVPSFPLDESNIILGGADKNAQVAHVGKVDEATFTVILSSLLGRLGDAERSGDRESMRKADALVSTYLEQVVARNTNELSSMDAMRRKRAEQPSKPLYVALMGSCSYMANAGELTLPDSAAVTRREMVDSDSDESLSSATGGNGTAMTDLRLDRIADGLYQRCEACPKSSSLTMFPRIHIITGVALVAKHLPAAAAEILSRPLDDLDHRTCFDLLRSTLEYLETNQLLVDSRSVDSEGQLVNARHLEHIVHEATSIWRRCIDMDPMEANHHAWYIGGLATSLLLCSGNRISSRARVLPSSKQTGSRYETFFSSKDNESAADQDEVRQNLPKFDPVRKDLAEAARELLEPMLGSTRMHMTAASFLEWKQVVALLVGPDGALQAWSDIGRLHAHHTIQWALQEKSLLAYQQVEHLSATGRYFVSRDVILSMLATTLENDPSVMNHWRALVDRLGAFGTHVTDQQKQECKSNECLHCPRLRGELHVDHAIMSLRQGREWWGTNRSSWWNPQLLMASHAAVTKHTRARILKLCDAVETELTEEEEENVGLTRVLNVQDRERVLEGDELNASREVSLNLNWLESTSEESDNDNSADQASSTRSGKYDSELPVAFQDVIASSKLQEPKSQPACLIPGLSTTDQHLELLSYQLAILCHLYSPHDETLRSGVWFLSSSCYKHTSNRITILRERQEWKCLLWLYGRGLDIVQILHDVANDHS